VIRRRRECLDCGRRFTSYERIDEIPYMVIKKDGTRERFERQKLVAGLLKACEKRPVSIAAIESVAENASDSVVAPLFYYVVGGVPAALAYRAINTLDAMIGYRGETEWLGKAAARLDDAANFIPARLTALLLAVASGAGGGSPARALALWLRDARKTESPNAGRPMAAMAGALGVELSKRGAYVLGAGLRAPAAADVRRAVRIFAVAVALAAAAALAVC